MAFTILFVLLLIASLAVWVLLFPLEWMRTLQLPQWFSLWIALLLLSWCLGE